MAFTVREEATCEKLALLVDLDGTLVLSDTLLESALRAIRNRWITIFLLPLWLLRGKAQLKQELARRGGVDATTLPYNGPLLAYLSGERARGRYMALVSACDTDIARAVAEHVGLFDSVLCSDGKLNLKGRAKSRLLEATFGHAGFAYAGNDASDLHVWKNAGAAILVNARPTVARRARSLTTVEAELPRRGRVWPELLRAMRMYQWVKNLLVFVAPMAAHTLLQPATALSAFQTFAAFSLMASGVYLANDLVDLEADRKHASKRTRPFASGTLPLTYGLWSPVLMGGGLILGFLVSPATGSILMLYAVLTSAYSLFLKTKPLVDVFCLSALYSIRLLAGAVATQTHVSIWLLSFSGFLFLALAFLKRGAETVSAPAARAQRRGYAPGDNLVLQTMGVASSFVSSLILALYVDSADARSIYPASYMLWAMVPLILFWQCRLWLSTARGQMRDDPIVYAARDWVSWVILGSMLFVFVLAMLGPTARFHHDLA